MPLRAAGRWILCAHLEIARHARNLQQVPKVSLMLIEDETGARELFARKRLTFDAVAEVVARDDARWEKAVCGAGRALRRDSQGLSNLKDFVLFRLKPEQGLFVKGFGQAFRVSGDELVDFVHLVEGHKRIDNGAELTSPADEPFEGTISEMRNGQPGLPILLLCPGLLLPACLVGEGIAIGLGGALVAFPADLPGGLAEDDIAASAILARGQHLGELLVLQGFPAFQQALVAAAQPVVISLLQPGGQDRREGGLEGEALAPVVADMGVEQGAGPSGAAPAIRSRR